MARQKPIRGGILTDDEVRAIVVAAEAAAGPDVVGTANKLGIDRDANVRLFAVRLQCANRREKLGLSLKQAAARLRVPQYRLRAIENGTLRDVDVEILRSYVQLLGVGRWFRRWVLANGRLAARIGIGDGSLRSQRTQFGKAGAQSNKRLQPTAPGAGSKRRG
jgi:transcriptional regulator with XRE-family HTH domain